MRIAFTSTDGVNIDEHFGRTRTFYVWDIDRERACFVGQVAAESIGDEDDRTTARANAIRDCSLVYTMQIGGPAAAKLAARGVLPVKTVAIASIAVTIEALQGVLRTKPPPWLRRALRHESPGARTLTP